MEPTAAPDVRVVGRYALYGAIAAGGMATVHLGRLQGPVGFSRTVAIKRLHAQFAADPEFVSMFLDEARLAARIRHPNVVPTLDVVATSGELFLVMDYVPGESLSRLARAARERQAPMPLRILSSIIVGVLHGLHSAHEARDERGHALGIVHRDVSPQNVLVGTDGVARVLDFGVAKAANRTQTTKDGQIKGKLAYMPPEQLRGKVVTRQADIYAAGVMLWELLTGERLFAADNEGATVTKILEGNVEAPSAVLARSHGTAMAEPALRAVQELDATTLRALRMSPADRYASAREMALEIERTCPPATASEVGDWVEMIARDVLCSRAAMIAEIESSASMQAPSLREHQVMNLLNGRSSGPFTVPDGAVVARPQDLAAPPPGSTPVSQPPPGLPAFLPPTFEGPPVTQPSSISVSQSSSIPVTSPSRPIAAALAGVLVGLLLLGGALYVRKHQTSVGPAGATASAVAPGPAATVAGSPSSSAAAPAPVPAGTSAGNANEAATTTATERPRPPPSATAPTRPTSFPRRNAPPPARTATPPTEDCSTPFYYDADGVKKYKERCLSSK